MKWLKEYCEMFNLTINGSLIMDNKIVIGTFDIEENIVSFFVDQKKYKLSDLAIVVVENFKLH